MGDFLVIQFFEARTYLSLNIQYTVTYQCDDRVRRGHASDFAIELLQMEPVCGLSNRNQIIITQVTGQALSSRMEISNSGHRGDVF